MSYAIRKDGHGWRSVNSPSDVGQEEYFSEQQPTQVAALIGIAAVSPRQIRMALTRAGIRSQVEATVQAGSQDLKDWYEYSTTFERSNAQVETMGQALGQSNEQLNALWVLAASL